MTKLQTMKTPKKPDRVKDDFNYTAFIQVVVKPHTRGCRKAKEYEHIMQRVIIDTFNDLRAIKKLKINVVCTSNITL